jgi:hypothetical protein
MKIIHKNLKEYTLKDTICYNPLGGRVYIETLRDRVFLNNLQIGLKSPTDVCFNGYASIKEAMDGFYQFKGELEKATRDAFNWSVRKRLANIISKSNSTLLNRLLTDSFDSKYSHLDFCSTDPFKISFHTFDSLEKCIFKDVDVYDQSCRMMSKVGKVLKNVFPDVTHAEIEQGVNEWLGIVQEMQFEFKIVKGEDVRFWYLEDNYSTRQTYSLQDSCLRYKRCQHWLDIFVDNPSKIELLTLINKEGLLEGRALIWTTDDGFKFMDRVYGSQGTQEAFVNYARRNKWWYRSRYNTFEDGEYVMSPQNGYINEIELSICVTLDNADHDYNPYLDTLVYSDGCGVFINRRTNKKLIHRYRCHEGSRFLYWEGDWYDDRNSEYIGRIDQRVPEEYLEFNTVSGNPIPTNHARMCQHINEYEWEEDCVQLKDKTYLPKGHEHLVKFNEHLYHKSQISKCSITDEVLPKDCLFEICGDNISLAKYLELTAALEKCDKKQLFDFLTSVV